MDDMRNYAPIYEALVEYRKKRVVSFDVPAHKQGKGTSFLADFLGMDCLSVDVNSMKQLDNLCHPTGVIKKAEELAASAFGASHAFFIVNGTTAAVQSMIFAVCKSGDKIIMPRNVHRSVINALILSGGVPVYVDPRINQDLGIPLGMHIDDLKRAVSENPSAKAIFVNNPTYYGICSDLRKIVQLAHDNNMQVLVDEAHGAHFYFSKSAPVSAMHCGADYSAVSMHKNGGSLTQSAFLVCGHNVDYKHLRQIINLTQTTSGSYLLMSSLDIARMVLVAEGETLFENCTGLACYARDEINKIKGYYAFSDEICDGGAVFDFDKLKLSVNTFGTGLAGIEVYRILRDKYHIQVEFGDICNMLALVSFADKKQHLERLVASLSEIERLYSSEATGKMRHEYICPKVCMSPQEAFYADKSDVDIEKSVGLISGEFIMCYPPGIPIIAPGEMITKEVIEYVLYAKNKKCTLTGTEDEEVNRVKVINF